MAREPKLDPIDKLAKDMGLTLKTSNKYTRKRAPLGGLLPIKTLYQLAWTNEPDSSNAEYVKFSALKKGINDEHDSVEFNSRTTTYMPNEEPRTWEQTVYALPDGYRGKLSEAPGVRVYCSCPRLKYKWDYALSTVGASDGLACQGIPSPVTNKVLKVATCKHLVRVMQSILSRSL